MACLGMSATQTSSKQAILRLELVVGEQYEPSLQHYQNHLFGEAALYSSLLDLYLLNHLKTDL